MKHYQKVKPTEKLIVKALGAKDDNAEIAEAFKRTLEFFDSYDKVEHTAHAEVMRKIYLHNCCYKYTDSTHGLPRKTGVPSRTLCRYRKKYLTYLYMFYCKLTGIEYTDNITGFFTVLKQKFNKQNHGGKTHEQRNGNN